MDFRTLAQAYQNRQNLPQALGRSLHNTMDGDPHTTFGSGFQYGLLGPQGQPAQPQPQPQGLLGRIGGAYDSMQQGHPMQAIGGLLGYGPQAGGQQQQASAVGQPQQAPAGLLGPSASSSPHYAPSPPPANLVNDTRPQPGGFGTPHMQAVMQMLQGQAALGRAGPTLPMNTQDPNLSHTLDGLQSLQQSARAKHQAAFSAFMGG